MSTRITKFLDLLELAEDPVFFMRFRAYMDKWESEKSDASEAVLLVVDKFYKLMEIVENTR